MNTRSGLLAGGNWVVDHVKLLNTWPPQDSLATIASESIANGGAPYNVLKDLAALGAAFPLAGVGMIGRDAFGDHILDDCRRCGINTAQLQRTDRQPTSYTDVMTVQSTGRRTFFHRRGANALLGPEHFDFSQTSAKLFHLGYLLLLDRLDEIDASGVTGAARVLTAARAAGLRTSLDCVSDNSDRFVPVARPALPHVDYFFANDFEATRLTGISVLDAGGRDHATLRAAAHRLLEFGVREWVFIHSPEGVFAGSRAGDLWQTSVRVRPEDIRGAAGAGDALAAGILMGLHDDAPVAQALRLGVCVAAASLHDPTCSGSIRPSAECLRLAEQFGFNE